jgi:hypothetical protein
MRPKWKNRGLNFDSTFRRLKKYNNYQVYIAKDSNLFSVNGIKHFKTNMNCTDSRVFKLCAPLFSSIKVILTVYTLLGNCEK